MGAGRPRKYTPERLEKECQRYFKSITRIRTVTEKKATDERDQYGHVIMIDEPVINRLGQPVTEIEYLLPPTVADLCDFLRIDTSTWERYCDPDQHPEFCRTTARVRGRLRAWNERELLTRSGSEVKGIIFNLENNYGYKQQAAMELSGGLERYISALGEDGNQGGF